MNRKFHRRTLLQGLGAGTALLSPFVRNVVAQADDAAGAGNVIIFYTPNGFRKDAFGATGSETSFTMRETTAVLEPHKSDLVVLQGISNMTYPGGNNSHENITRILTCVEGTEVKKAGGPSIDHFIASKLGQTPMVLGVQPARSAFQWFNQLSWAAAGSATRPNENHKQVFSDIFGSVVGGGSEPDADAARVNKRNKSVLDALRSDVTTLRGRLDKAGRDKLDLHTSSLRELEQNIQRNEVGQMMCDYGMVQTKVNGSLPSVPSGTPVSSKAYTPLLQAHGELQMDLIATALACGQRRVATLLWQECSYEGVNVDGDNANESHHKVSHYSSDPITGDGPRQLKAIERFYAARFASLLTKLKALGILDNTMVVWCSEVAEGHTQANSTWIAAGGKNLGIRTGRYLNFNYKGRGDDPRPSFPTSKSTSDLWVSVKKAMGIPGDTFGAPQWCTGGLQEYFVG